jgi:DNA-binding MurR/RpiR family transcriptional regulator
MASKNVLGLLKSMLNELPKAERRIAEKILEEPEEIVHMTASELGEHANSSAATVIRLSKRLKISSFTELKIFISREVESENREVYSDIDADESVQAIMDKLHWNSSLAMKDTASMLEEEAILQAADMIRDASVVYTFGIGASSLVAENISQKWSRIGKTCIHVKDAHVLLAALVGSEKDAVFIGISNSGETHEVIKLDDMAHKHGHKTISVTRFGDNPLSKKADVSLQHVRANEIEMRSAATSSLHAQFLVVDVLFYVYVSRNYDQALTKIFDSRGAVVEYNEEMKDE